MNKAEKLIVEHFNKCSFTRNNIVNLKYLDSYMTENDQVNNSNSRYGDKICNGTYRRIFVRIRGESKILWGRCYHNINNMWWIVLGKTKFTNIANFDILEELLPTTKELSKFGYSDLPKEKRE